MSIEKRLTKMLNKILNKTLNEIQKKTMNKMPTKIQPIDLGGLCWVTQPIDKAWSYWDAQPWRCICSWKSVKPKVLSWQTCAVPPKQIDTWNSERGMLHPFGNRSHTVFTENAVHRIRFDESVRGSNLTSKIGM